MMSQHSKIGKNLEERETRNSMLKTAPGLESLPFLAPAALIQVVLKKCNARNAFREV